MFQGRRGPRGHSGTSNVGDKGTRVQSNPNFPAGFIQGPRGRPGIRVRQLQKDIKKKS